jgi:TetR/AcrR family transcriptional regulator
VKTPPPELAERLWAVGDRVLEPGTEVRVDELAELTGVPRATLYYYFSGRDDVLAFLLAQKIERGTAAVTDAAHGPGTPTQRLEAVLRAMLRAMADHPALCTRVMGSMATEGGSQIMMEIERAIMAPVRELLVAGQTAGDFADADPGDATTSLVGAISMVAMRHTINGDFDPETVADRLVPQLLHGVCLQRRPVSPRRRKAPRRS